MDLVGYSDSESSDAEPQSASSTATKAPKVTANPNTSKTNFQKVVQRSEPHKIRVNLPLAQTTSDEKDGRDAPPAKRARTAGAFSGFNSFLPEPKNASKPPGGAGASSLGHLRGQGLGKGVNLKTGAAPAFSREPITESYAESQGREESEVQEHNSTDQTVNFPEQGQTKEEDNALHPAQKPVMFKPLSVARKPAKKKKPTSATSNHDQMSNGLVADKAEAKTTGLTDSQRPLAKPKRSLFASHDLEIMSTPQTTDGEYKPLLVTADEDPRSQDETNNLDPASPHLDSIQTAQPTDLENLADNLGLTASQRRQLFGRHGKPDEAQMKQFSLAAEYAHNRELLENQSNAPVVNPVRSIAPGKHSLQQLLNAASNQKDALEESFAQGRRNKKDAGSKYGW